MTENMGALAQTRPQTRRAPRSGCFAARSPARRRAAAAASTSSARNVADSSRLRHGPPCSSPSSSATACSSGLSSSRAPLGGEALVQLEVAVGRVEDPPDDELRRGRPVPACSPGGGTRRRSGRRGGSGRAARRGRRRSRCPAGRPRSADAEAEVLALADGVQVGELAAGDEQVDAGVAEPERREPAAAPRRGRASSAEPGTIASTVRHRPQVVLGEVLVGVGGERLGERVDVPPGGSRGRRRRGGRRSARGARRRRRGRACRSKAGIERPRALPVAVRAGDQDDRAGCSARRAARRRSRSRPRASPRRRRRSRGGRARASGHASICGARLAQDAVLDRLALAVQLLELGGDALRGSSSSSVSSSSSAAVGRPSRPAALIRGASRKPTAPSSTTAGSTRAARISARRPGRVVVASRSQAGDRERPVLVDERDDVGDRRERDEVEVLLERRAGAEQRLAELVDDAGAAELRERVVGGPGGDDRAVGQLVAGAVVVGDDHVEPGGARLARPPRRR